MAQQIEGSKAYSMPTLRRLWRVSICMAGAYQENAAWLNFSFTTCKLENLF
jgi:hypothetical protein